MKPNPELIKAMTAIQDVGEMERFLSEILTENERQQINLRWQLMDLLQQGIPQREVATRLGVSLCKITRGAKILKEDHSVSRKLLEIAPKID